MGKSARPDGVSSRFRRAKGPRHPWSTGTVTIDLPVIVYWVNVDPGTGEETVRIEARVDLIGDQPEIVDMSLAARDGLDLVALQRDFQWASPLSAVTGILPRLIDAGSDPFAVDLPVTGFPAVAIQPQRRGGVLSDEFLTTSADEYFVTPGTVVSWVEKASARGILSAPPAKGAAGDHLLTKAGGPFD